MLARCKKPSPRRRVHTRLPTPLSAPVPTASSSSGPFTVLTHTTCAAGSEDPALQCAACPVGQYSPGRATPCYATYACDKDQGKCLAASGTLSQADCEAQGCAQQTYLCDVTSATCVVNANGTQAKADCDGSCCKTPPNNSRLNASPP